jgi:hypothetical protein
MRDLQPLDILLYRGTGFTSWLIEFATSSPYSHVAVVVDPESHVGIESNAGHQSGVRAFDLRKLPEKEIDIYRLKPEYAAKVNSKKVSSFLVGHLEAGYDWGGVIGLGLLKLLSLITFGLTKQWHNDFQEKKDYFCSELCYAAFDSGGIDIVPQIDSSTVTSPGDISKSPILEKIN